MTKLNFKKFSKKEFLGIPVVLLLAVAIVVLVVVYWKDIKDWFNKESFGDATMDWDDKDKDTTQKLFQHGPKSDYPDNVSGMEGRSNLCQDSKSHPYYHHSSYSEEGQPDSQLCCEIPGKPGPDYWPLDGKCKMIFKK